MFHYRHQLVTCRHVPLKLQGSGPRQRRRSDLHPLLMKPFGGTSKSQRTWPCVRLCADTSQTVRLLAEIACLQAYLKGNPDSLPTLVKVFLGREYGPKYGPAGHAPGSSTRLRRRLQSKRQFVGLPAGSGACTSSRKQQGPDGTPAPWPTSDLPLRPKNPVSPCSAS